MLAHKGGQIINVYWGGESRDVTPTKLQCQNIQRPLHTLETHGRSLQKWACIFLIFHAAMAVILLDSSK